METYTLVSFILNVLLFITQVIKLTSDEWPKIEIQTAQQASATALLSLAFALWAGVTLWLHA